MAHFREERTETCNELPGELRGNGVARLNYVWSMKYSRRRQAATLSGEHGAESKNKTGRLLCKPGRENANFHELHKEICIEDTVNYTVEHEFLIDPAPVKPVPH